MNAEIALMVIGMAVAGSIIFGVVIGVFLRKHHAKWLHVVLGGAIFMAMMYLMILVPFIIFNQLPPDGGLKVTPMLPGIVLMMLLIFSSALYRLPIIGAPLLAWALATARMQAERAQRQISKLEGLESELHNLARA